MSAGTLGPDEPGPEEPAAHRASGSGGPRSPRTPVLTAIADPLLEAQVLSALARPRSRMTVARRCVDLADLLAVAATGTATAALVGADLRRLDQEAVVRLQRQGIVVVGVNDDAAAGAERTEARLRQLGVPTVVAVSTAANPTTRTAPTPTTLDELAGRLADAVERAARDRPDVGGRRSGAAGPSQAAERIPDDAAAAQFEAPESTAREGRVLAVWGPTGAPGRTFLTWNLGHALAVAGRRVLLVDADTYGGTLAQYAGMVDEAPGVVAACRAANAGALDADRLAGLARAVPAGGSGDVAVLTGIGRATRWPEVRPAALARVLDLAGLLADDVLVDCGFALEQDEELTYDTLAPQRNGATLAAIGAADEVLAVGAADAIGLTRLISGLGDLAELDGPGEISVVLNRLRPGGRERRQVEQALERHAGRSPLGLLPQNGTAADRALELGRSVPEAAARTPLALALHELASRIAGSSSVVPSAGGRRRRLGRATRP